MLGVGDGVAAEGRASLMEEGAGETVGTDESDEASDMECMDGLSEDSACAGVPTQKRPANSATVASVPAAQCVGVLGRENMTKPPE